MEYIRRAKLEDLGRISEIEVFNYRLNFYPTFRNDDYYFNQLQVTSLIKEYCDHPVMMEQTFVYNDDGVVKGFIRRADKEVKKLFIEPVFQSKGIGAALLDFAVEQYDVCSLWVLEKNAGAISFYIRHGFHASGERKKVDDTAEYLIRLIR